MEREKDVIMSIDGIDNYFENFLERSDNAVEKW